MTNASNEETHVTATQTACAAPEDAHGMPEENTSWVEKYPAEFREILLQFGQDDTDDDVSRRINMCIVACESDLPSGCSSGWWISTLEDLQLRQVELEEDYQVSEVADRLTFDEFYDLAQYVLEVAVLRGWALPDAEEVRKREEEKSKMYDDMYSINHFVESSDVLVALSKGGMLRENVSLSEAVSFICSSCMKNSSAT